MEKKKRWVRWGRSYAEYYNLLVLSFLLKMYKYGKFLSVFTVHIIHFYGLKDCESVWRRGDSSQASWVRMIRGDRFFSSLSLSATFLPLTSTQVWQTRRQTDRQWSGASNGISLSSPSSPGPIKGRDDPSANCIRIRINESWTRKKTPAARKRHLYD